MYTITVTNSRIAPTSGFTVVDYLPAGLEYLGCTAIDNTAGDTVEYAGAPRLDASPRPAMTDCVAPSAVSTVTLDPDGDGQLPDDVYTEVTWWGLGDLAANESLTIEYAAAIPLRENVASAADPIANLDNNTGALTTDELQLTNRVTAEGTYGGTVYSSSATKTVSAEDVAIRKSVNRPDIAHDATSTWTLVIESSEYALSTEPIIVTDTIPNGLDFADGVPTPDTAPAAQPDGTVIATWTIPPCTARNSSAVITYTTTTLMDYRDSDGSGGPVSAQDGWSNDVALATNSNVISDAGAVTTLVPTNDASSASQSAGGVTLTKEVSTAASTSSDPCPTDDSSYVKSATGCHPGDVLSRRQERRRAQ